MTNRAEVTIEYWDGQQQQWPRPDDGKTSMDQAVAEIVDWLDNRTPFPYAAAEAVRTLEAIVGFHASHARNAVWTELPLAGDDRDREVLSS